MEAWNRLHALALKDGIELELISGFRSYEYQAGLITRKLVKGELLKNVLTKIAPPGYSEHHTGRAVDISTSGFPALEEVFEQSDAFNWLCQNAPSLQWRLSYPRDNPMGYIYEPWHWFYWG